jgi:hypothetical protein
MKCKALENFSKEEMGEANFYDFKVIFPPLKIEIERCSLSIIE